MQTSKYLTKYTKSGARLQLLIENESPQDYNWLFFPGGPGLGSESLIDLVNIVSAPGKNWLVDFPGDGSNTHGNFADWHLGLLEAVRSLDNVIVVAHSSAGFFVLSVKECEKEIIGLVLISSAPSADWQIEFCQYVENHPIPDLNKLMSAYTVSPTNELLKEASLASIPYFSTSVSKTKLTKLFETLPFNHISHDWEEANFKSSYVAKWAPQNIPTLIFTGLIDPITPIKLFLNDPDFQRNNITIYAIENASHYPWYDNPGQVKKLFYDYIDLLTESRI